MRIADRRTPNLPRWIFRIGWAVHDALYRFTGGRIGLQRPDTDALGTLRLRTIGRRSGRERATMLFYVDDGDDLVVIGSNVGSDTPPAWWRNLQAEPHAWVDLPDGRRRVRASAAEGERRERLWQRFASAFPNVEHDAEATDREIPVVILAPDTDADTG